MRVLRVVVGLSTWGVISCGDNPAVPFDGGNAGSGGSAPGVGGGGGLGSGGDAAGGSVGSAGTGGTSGAGSGGVGAAGIGASGAGDASGGGGGGQAGGAGAGASAGGGGAAAAGGGAAGAMAGSTGTGGSDGISLTAMKTAAAYVDRLIGAAISTAHLSDPAYAATAAVAFNFATPENEMKWDATEPTRNVFDFTGGDAIVAFATGNGMKVKGHNLVWHSQLPSWVPAIQDATDLHNAMINHVTEVAWHFRGQVIAWDVVNEAVSDSGGLRNSIFLQLLGPSYIDDAFNAAHAADPDAHLFYNDYGAEGMNAKSNAVYNLVQGMLARGVPIHGVGLEMHTGPTDASPSADEVAANMERLGALGLEIVISEMDVQICTSDVTTQSARFHDIVADCVGAPTCTAVTVWGVPDKYSWRNGQTCATPRPLLFDDNYAPKPAYTGVLDAFSGR